MLLSLAEEGSSDNWALLPLLTAGAEHWLLLSTAAAAGAVSAEVAIGRWFLIWGGFSPPLPSDTGAGEQEGAPSAPLLPPMCNSSCHWMRKLSSSDSGT